MPTTPWTELRKKKLKLRVLSSAPVLVKCAQCGKETMERRFGRARLIPADWWTMIQTEALACSMTCASRLSDQIHV